MPNAFDDFAPSTDGAVNAFADFAPQKTNAFADFAPKQNAFADFARSGLSRASKLAPVSAPEPDLSQDEAIGDEFFKKNKTVPEGAQLNWSDPKNPKFEQLPASPAPAGSVQRMAADNKDLIDIGDEGAALHYGWKALKYAGGVVRGLTEDVAEIFRNRKNINLGTPITANLGTEEEPYQLGQNIGAAALKEPTPTQEKIKDIHGAAGVLAKISGTVSEMLPSLAASGGLTTLMRGAGMGETAAVMASGGITFGTDENGNFDAKQAVLMAVMPLAGKAGAIIATKTVEKMGIPIASETGLKALETTGSFLGAQTYFDALAAPEYIHASPEQRAEIWAHNFGVNLALHVPAAIGLAGSAFDENRYEAAFKDTLKQNGNYVARLGTMPDSLATLFADHLQKAEAPKTPLPSEMQVTPRLSRAAKAGEPNEQVQPTEDNAVQTQGSDQSGGTGGINRSQEVRNEEVPIDVTSGTEPGTKATEVALPAANDTSAPESITPDTQWRVNVNTADSKNVVKTVSASTAEEAEGHAATLPDVKAVQKGTARQWDTTVETRQGALPSPETAVPPEVTTELAKLPANAEGVKPRLVAIVKPDGTREIGAFNDDVTEFQGKKYVNVARWNPEAAKWSHGLLKPDETIQERGKQASLSDATAAEQPPTEQPIGDAAVADTSRAGATGVEGIRELINRPESNLLSFTKRVINAMLDTPVMKNLDWGRLHVVLSHDIEGGRYAGSASVLDHLIELSRTADATAFPHEVFHFLYEMLPTEDRLTLDSMRREAIKNFPREGLSPEAVAVLDKLDRGETLTSDEFQKDLPRELYRLINPSEFLAEFASKKFESGVFESRNQSVIGALKDRVVEYVKGVLDSLARVFGIRPSLERIYRELLAGKHDKSMLESVQQYARGRQGAFAKDAEEARNAETLAQTHEQQEVEATHLLAQSHDIVDVLGKHGTGTIGDASKTLLGWFDYLGIDAAGRRLNGGIGEGYRQLKARLDPYNLVSVARFAQQQMGLMSRRMTEVIAQRDEEQAKLSKPGFLKLIAREAAAKAKMDHADTTLRITQSIFHSALAMAHKALKQEGKSDLEVAHIEGEINALDDASKSSSAMQQLLTDMVNVLSSTPDGMRALTDPDFGTRKLLKDIYSDLKRTTDPEANLHKSSLLNWAAYILNKSKELRENLLASHLASRSTVRDLMGPYEAKFMADFEADPIKTIKREIRTQSKLATDKEKAAFAWRVLHKDATERLDHFAVLDNAAEVASKVLADPDLKSLRTEIRDDAKVIGEQKPADVFTKNTVVLPDLTQVEIDPKRIVGSKTEFAAVRGEFETAIAKLRAWLNNPANAGDLNYRTHERNLQTMEDYFTGLSILQPNDALHFFERSWGILKNVVQIAGGRVGAQTRLAVSRFDTDHRQASWWTQRYSHQLAESAQRAIRSHDIKYGVFGKSLTEANDEWFTKVGNQLAYSYNRSAGALKVGDMLASGEKVTQADMDHLRLTAESITKGFDIVGDRQMSEDTLGGFTTFRQALKGNPLMTVRVFNDDLANFSKDFLAHRADHLQAVANGNAVKAAVAEKQMLKVLDTYFARIGTAFTWDRNPDFAKTTPFDGPGGAFENLGKWMSNDPTRITNTTDYFKELSALSALSPDEAKRVILNEWGRIVEGWNREAVTEERNDLPRAEQSKNSFTRSRNEALAPYVFYDNGFRNTASVLRFSGGMFSRSMDEVVSGLKALSSDMDRQKKDFEDKIALGSTKGEVISRNALDRRNGDNYDKYKILERRKAYVEDMIKTLTNSDDMSLDSTFVRYMNFLKGTLIATMATARNVTTGPRYIGSTMNRLMASNLKSYPVGMFFTWLDAPLRALTSLGYGVAKASTFDITVGAGKAIWGLKESERGDRTGDFIHTLFRGVIKELGDNVYARLAEVQRMKAAGLMGDTNAVREWDNRLLGSWISGGAIPGKELSTTEKFLQAPVAVAETLWLSFQKSLMPLFGDTTLNMAASTMMKSSAGPFAHYERAMRRLYMEWKSSPYRVFDFTNPKSEKNLLSAREVFPRGWGDASANPATWFPRLRSDDSDLQKARSIFEAAGLNLDEEAAKFMAELDKGNKNATFMDESARNSLINTVIDDANRSSASNDPLRLKQKTFWNVLVSPFMFWKTRMFSQFMNMLSGAQQMEGSAGTVGKLRKERMLQVAAIATTVLLPAMFYGAMTSAGDEEAARRMRLALFNQITGFRQPWEREGTESQARGWLVHAFNGVPFIDMAMNAMMNDMPNRASMDPSLVAVEKLKDIARYVGGVAQTHDVFYKLPQLIGGLFPDTKLVMNRMESQAGKRDVANVAALVSRNGPTELLRPSGAGNAGGVMVNELTPYADKMVNAAAGGNMPEFQKVYEEAVQVARNLGRPDPEKVVAQMFKSRNPYSRALKSEMTPDQREAFLNSLAPDERARVETVEQNLQQAAQTIGSKMSFVSGDGNARQNSRTPSVATAASGAGSSKSGGASVASASSVGGGRGSLSRAGRVTVRARVTSHGGRLARGSRSGSRRKGFARLSRAPRLA